MPLEKYEYPKTGTVTASWYPTRNPTYVDLKERVKRGILMDDTAGDDSYFYKQATESKNHARRADRFVLSEWTGYDAFRRTVGGEEFKFTDGQAVSHTVQFIPDDDEVDFSIADRRSWRYSMREKL